VKRVIGLMKKLCASVAVVIGQSYCPNGPLSALLIRQTFSMCVP